MKQPRQPKDLRYFLTLEGKEYELPHAPEGWDESSLAWKMVGSYMGLFREFSYPFSFVLDGAYILRRSFYRKGIRAQSFFRVELLDRATWEYEEIFGGEVDFSTFQDSENFVEVNIVEGGISKKIKAYENVEYEFACDDLQVRIPGIDVVDYATFNCSYFSSNRYYLNGDYIPNFEDLSSKILFNKVEFSGVEEYENEGNPINISTEAADSNFILGISPVNIRMQGSFTYIFCESYSYGEYELQVVRGNGQVVSTLFSTKGNAIPVYFTPAYYPQSYEFDVNFPLAAGEKLYLYVRFISGARGIFNIGSSDITVSYSVTTDSTIVPAKRPFNLFKELVEKMYGAEYEVKSTLLSVLWDNLVIVPGDAIRGITNPVIKTSFSKFFKSYNAVLNIGLCQEGKALVLEQKEYMFQPYKLLDLGEVASAEFSPATDHLYSNIKAGYPPDDYESEQGKEEFNSEQMWSTPLDRSVTTLDLMSLYSADQHGIEKLRLTTIVDNASKKDKKNDNKIYFLHVKKEPEPFGDGVNFEAIGNNKVIVDGDYSQMGDVVYINGDRYNVIEKTTTGTSGLNVIPNVGFRDREDNIIQGWQTIQGSTIPASNWVGGRRGLYIGGNYALESIGPIVTLDVDKTYTISHSIQRFSPLNGKINILLFNGAAHVGSRSIPAGSVGAFDFNVTGITNFYTYIEGGGYVLTIQCYELSITTLTINPYEFTEGETGILHIGGRVHDVLGSENYNHITGISTRSSSYNLDITPKKNLLRHGDYLKSMLSGEGYISFASADKNAEFSTIDLTGKYIKENQDIYVNEIPNQLFSPIIAKIKTKVPINLHKIMNANTKGYIEFSYLSKKFRGFPIEVSQDVARNSVREFKLLLTDNTNISPLIRKN